MAMHELYRPHGFDASSRLAILVVVWTSSIHVFSLGRSRRQMRCSKRSRAGELRPRAIPASSPVQEFQESRRSTMRSLLRFSLALLGVCCALSSSQAFWWHKKDKTTAVCEAPGATCAQPSFMAVQQDVVSTRTVMVPVQQQVVTKRTVLVPVSAAPAGCTGAPAGAGCHGAGVGAGCHGAGVGAGCHGTGAGCVGSRAGGGCTGGGRTGFDNYLERGSHDAFAPNLAKLENRIFNIETKLDLLTESVNNWNDAAKANTKTALPAIPPLPNGSFKPTPIGSMNPTETDPVLAAARAYKARQAALPIVAIPLLPETDLTRK
jgi:hypothetical protein